VKHFRDLIAWQKSMDLVIDVYQITKSFPNSEQFGLTSQIRRAVVSVPSNIAEGNGRMSSKEFRHFLSIANGSLREVETQLIIAQRLGYFDDENENVSNKIFEIGKLILGLIKKQDKTG